MFGFATKEKGLDDCTQKAYNIRERRDVSMVSAVDPRSAAIMTSGYVQGERLKNFCLKVPEMVKTENVVSICVTACQGTGEWVVMLIDADGRKTSFWTEASGINNELPVRSISNY